MLLVVCPRCAPADSRLCVCRQGAVRLVLGVVLDLNSQDSSARAEASARLAQLQGAFEFKSRTLTRMAEWSSRGKMHVAAGESTAAASAAPMGEFKAAAAAAEQPSAKRSQSVAVAAGCPAPANLCPVRVGGLDG